MCSPKDWVRRLNIKEKKDECALWIHELYKFKSNVNYQYIDTKILGWSNIIIYNMLKIYVEKIFIIS